MNRSLKLSMLLALALGSSQVAAVELGPVHVRSLLGQPLVADVPITQATPAELRSLSAQLAQNAGSTAATPSVPLQLTITGSGNQRWIHITSREPVQDPYLDLLIEISAAGASSTHEVSVLLDPPGEDVQAPVAPPASPRPAPMPVAAPSRSSPPPPAMPGYAPMAAAARPARAEHSYQYGPVEKGQTLSSIARATAPAGVDINQMLLALKQANPDAFFRDNINALKSGAILRVPSRAVAEQLSVQAAAQQVRQQDESWRHGSAVPVTVAAAATRANAGGASAAEGASRDRLALVPPAGKGGDKASRQALARSREALASLQQQDADLKSRIKALQDIGNKDQRLLSLKDDQIAQLQRELAAARKTAGLPPLKSAATTAPPRTATVAPTAAASAPAKPAGAPAAAKTAAVPAPASTQSPKASHPGPTVATKPVAARPAPPPASPQTPWYLQPLVWIAGLLVLVLLVLFGLRRRRRGVVAPARNLPSLSDRFPADPVVAANTDPEQDDLLDQLAEHPDDLDLHLQLVGLYYHRQDVEHFEAAAEAMYAHISEPQQSEWQDVVYMGRELAPGHPLFAERAAAAEHDTATHGEALHPFDLDQYAAVPPPVPPESRELHQVFDAAPQFNLPVTAMPPSPELSPEPPPPPPVLAGDAQHAATLDPAYAVPEELAAVEEGFSDDPNDTKLDLARAYLDMGDPEGARAMLEEVLKDGSQMQRDVAQRLMDSLH